MRTSTAAAGLEDTQKRQFWPFLVSLGVSLVIVIFGNISVYRFLMLEDLTRPYDDAAYLDKATRLDDVFLDRLHFLINRWVVGPSFRDTSLSPGKFSEQLWLEILDHENKQELLAGTEDFYYRIKLAKYLFSNTLQHNHTTEEAWRASKRVLEALGSLRTFQLERFMTNFIGYPMTSGVEQLIETWLYFQTEYETIKSEIPQFALRADMFWTKYELTHRPGICQSCLSAPTDPQSMIAVYQKLFQRKTASLLPFVYRSHWTSDDFTGWSYLFSPLLVALVSCLIYFTIAQYISVEYI